MKICILSMQDVQNYGSLLQAYSLKKILKDLGHEVAFISIEPNEKDNALMKQELDSFQDEIEKYSSSAFLTKIKKVDRYILNRIRHKKDTKEQFLLFDNFRKKYLGNNESNGMFDLCIIGSDEVFNCLIPSKWGFTTQLFGNVRQATKVITYAASCGSTTYDKLTEAVGDAIESAFAHISAFSARDDNTKRFIEFFTEADVVEHLDPVLIGNFSKEMHNTDIPACLNNKRFCLVYSYDNRINSEKEIESISAFCKDNNLTLYSVGAPQMWIKHHLVLDPFQLINVFSKAEFVITDTFHGTIFSAKYAKKYGYIVRDSNKNKLGDLAKKIRITDHKIQQDLNLDRVYSLYEDKNGLNGIIDAEKNRSIRYIVENL